MDVFTIHPNALDELNNQLSQTSQKYIDNFKFTFTWMTDDTAD